MRRRLTVALACLSNLLGGCVENDVDQSWDLHEVRTLVRSAASHPSRASAGQFSVTVPLGVDRHSMALAATESLILGNGAKVVQSELAGSFAAYVSSTGGLLLERNAEAGYVYAFGAAPVFEDGVTIRDGCKTLLTPQERGRIRVRLGYVEGVEGFVEQFSWRVRFDRTVGASERGETDGASFDLPPGTYRSLLVKPHARATIRAGEYIFDSLEVREGGTLLIDNTNGPVYVWVGRSMTLNGPMVDYRLRANVMVGYGGTTSPVINVPFRATLVAPDAIITLPATPQPHSGSVFARSIVVADRATLEHRPFAGSEVYFSPPAVVCNSCAAIAKYRMVNCCNDASRAAFVTRTALDNCISRCEVSGGAEREALCSRACDAEAARDQVTPRRDMDHCVAEAASGFDECERSGDYRIGTCLSLGFRVPTRASCGH